MSYQRSGFKLNRERGQRRALVRNLSASLIRKGKIKTTVPKAKAIKPFVERLVTHAKKNTLAGRRILISRTGEEVLAKKLINVIAPKYEKRQGGYLRITRLGKRLSDGAEMAQIEFV